MQLGAWRRAQRNLYGEPWTQEDAARWYGVSVRTWRRYERERTPLHVIKRVCEYERSKFKREIKQ